jgi:hypothetical protein
MTMAAEFNKMNQDRVKFNTTGPVSEHTYDPLPLAYTSLQKSNINESITTVLGAYDHELTPLFKHSQYAITHLKFVTYIYSEIKKYFAVMDKDSNTMNGEYGPTYTEDGLEIRTDNVLDPQTGQYHLYTIKDVGVTID